MKKRKNIGYEERETIEVMLIPISGLNTFNIQGRSI